MAGPWLVPPIIFGRRYTASAGYIRYEESHFLRIHRHYIVNLNCAKHFNRNEGMVVLDNRMELPIVRNQYERFLEKFHRF